MEAPIGVNISEILQGIKRARDIYDAFFDPFNAAPEPIRQLVNTAKDIHDILQESELLLRMCNRPFPGQQGFNKRLNETYIFISRYCEPSQVQPRNPVGSPVPTPLVWKHLRNSWEDKKVKQLHNALMIETQKFMQFIFVLAL